VKEEPEARPVTQRPDLSVPLPELLHSVVDVASYVGTAAAAGVIGNRADAKARRLFAGVRARWRRRAADDPALTESEAVDAAVAAAIVHGFGPDGITPLTRERREDGVWIVTLYAGGETLRARIPPGDPGTARILIV
jgi:hypothetical protein